VFLICRQYGIRMPYSGERKVLIAEDFTAIDLAPDAEVQVPGTVTSLTLKVAGSIMPVNIPCSIGDRSSVNRTVAASTRNLSASSTSAEMACLGET
jgi:hypothetical protein